MNLNGILLDLVVEVTDFPISVQNAPRTFGVTSPTCDWQNAPRNAKPLFFQHNNLKANLHEKLNFNIFVADCIVQENLTFFFHIVANKFFQHN